MPSISAKYVMNVNQHKTHVVSKATTRYDHHTA